MTEALMLEPEQPLEVLPLHAQSISKHFDGVFAVREANLSLRRGEIHALLGENGAGKDRKSVV